MGMREEREYFVGIVPFQFFGGSQNCKKIVLRVKIS
jgi:hypothetical protein